MAGASFLERQCNVQLYSIATEANIVSIIILTKGNIEHAPIVRM